MNWIKVPLLFSMSMLSISSMLGCEEPPQPREHGRCDTFHCSGNKFSNCPGARFDCGNVYSSLDNC
jgi:hypothetical protein